MMFNKVAQILIELFHNENNIESNIYNNVHNVFDYVLIILLMNSFVIQIH